MIATPDNSLLWSTLISAKDANSTSALVGIIMEADCLIVLRPNSSAPPVV